jgi:DnaJ-domain-containing protein 1
LCHDKGNLARFVKTGEKQGKATYAGLGRETLEKLLRTGVAERKKNGPTSKDSDDYRRFFEKHCVSERTYLDILEFGNTEQPTMKEISKRFRTLMRRYHPDKIKGKDTKGKEDMAQKLSEAYTALQEMRS